MANEKDDVLKANQGAPAADIPDLKKKDKERKKAGAAWSGAQGGGTFSGATGGSVARAAASAASAAGAGEAAAVGAAEAFGGGGLWATIARAFAGLTSTLLGKLAVAAAAFLLMGAAGLVGYAMLKGGGDAGAGGLNLGGITDSLKVRAGGNDRIGIRGGGEIRFDPLGRAVPPKEAPKTDDKKVADKTAADAVPEKKPDDSASGVPLNRLAHNLSGAKLSSSLGGDFGSKNIFSGNNSLAPKFDISKAGMPKLAASKGKLGTMHASTVHGRTSSRSIGRGSSGRAIGQLKLAKGMSMLGAQANSAEEAASAANGAFDQQQTTGGDLSAHPPGEVVTPPSTGGAPDTTMPSAPTSPSSSSVDPGLQNSLNQIGQMADQARQMKQQGMELIAAGIAIMIIGYALIDVIWTAAIGAAIIAIGAMIMGMGYMMMQMADQMAAMAKSMGNSLSQQIGNPVQGNAINYCTDQALGGTPTSQCHPPDSITNANAVDQQDRTGAERVRHLADDTPVIKNTTPQ